MGVNIDGVLVHWGERLFYPRNRIVRAEQTPHLHARAAVIRRRITGVVRHWPQVIVRVAGGGKGMAAVRGHLKYITKSATLEFEDDRETAHRGKDALKEVARQWRYGGAYIPEASNRRDALNIVLAMRRGTDPELVRKAARGFAREELAGHCYVMVLHRHQASPHVHLCVKVESATGQRLNPGPADLKRWRETFAEKLQELGVEADATPQAVRGALRNFELPWEMKAREEGRLKKQPQPEKSSSTAVKERSDAFMAWAYIIQALDQSDQPADAALAWEVADFVRRAPFIKELVRQRGKSPWPEPACQQERPLNRKINGPEWTR